VNNALCSVCLTTPEVFCDSPDCPRFVPEDKRAALLERLRTQTEWVSDKAYNVYPDGPEVVTLPLIGARLLIAEHSRQTGQGGYARMVNSEPDEHGNQWTVSRREVDGEDALYLTCEMNQFAYDQAREKLRKVTSEQSDLALEKRGIENQRKKAFADYRRLWPEDSEREDKPEFSFPLDGRLSEVAGLLQVANRQAEALQEAMEVKGFKEWRFPVDLKGVRILVDADLSDPV